MNLHIENVGRIENIDVIIDGLTVITGNNSCGKTTIGKTLYSVLESINDIEIGQLNEAIKIASNALRECTFNIRRINDKEQAISAYNKIIDIKNTLHISETIDDVKNHLLSIIKIIDNFAIDFSKENENRISVIKEIISKSIHSISSFENIDFYLKNTIYDYFNNEFSKQVQPISNCNCDSFVKISDNDNNLDVTFNKKGVVDEKTHVNNYLIFNNYNAFFVDNPLVIDDMNKIPYYGFPDEDYYHTAKVKKSLSNFDKNKLDLMNKYSINANIKEIKNIINQALPNSVYYNNEERQYLINIDDQFEPLKVENLATGAKIFAIINALIENNCIDKNTFIILDEPESRLHPEWQIHFANIITKIVSIFGCKVLLTTHSPNFVLALETYSKINKIFKFSNFYHCMNFDEGLTEKNFICVNSSIDIIYKNLTDSFSNLLEELKKVDIK